MQKKLKEVDFATVMAETSATLRKIISSNLLIFSHENTLKKLCLDIDLAYLSCNSVKKKATEQKLLKLRGDLSRIKKSSEDFGEIFERLRLLREEVRSFSQIQKE